jgi:HK97 family phage prohead protease
MSSAVMSRIVQPIRNDSFSIIKSDSLVIGGYASIEMVDKQNDLITLNALGEAVKKYMTVPKFRNVMTNHSNVQVGEVIPQYRDRGGKLWKTEVDDVGFFVVIKIREDIEKAKEVGRDIRSGSLRSFSIGGQALEKKTKSHKDFGDYNEISKLELHEVTVCEKGINPEAKFNILKQDKGDNMNEVENALEELNKTLDKINNGGIIEKTEENTEKDIKNFDKTEEIEAGATEMSDLEKEEELEELEALDTNDSDEDMEYMGGENPNMPEEEGTEMKSNPDLPTGQVEAGRAGDLVSDSHDQLDAKYMAKLEDQSTLDLSAENLEKAYSQFKAEQLEKMAFDKVKSTFSDRFNNEMVSKTEEIEKANYDAKAEVTELKKQFTDLLDSLKNEQETVIRKQEETVAALNIPSSEEIAKMDWREINAFVESIEGKI